MLSVVITVFEQAETLHALLNCLTVQDIDDEFEILICDDGSAEWCLGNIPSNSRLRELDIRYLWQSKMGHRVARSKNNALRCARGDLVVLLDGDILVKPDFLRKHRDAHRSKNQIVCNPRRWLLGTRLVRRDPRSRQSEEFNLFPKLGMLAETDIPSLFALLDRISLDVDCKGQKVLSESASPWMACLGYSFSLDWSAAPCYFDESFIGWGPEDREFALRLSRTAGYNLVFREDIIVYHLEAFSTGRTPFLPLPTEPHQVIEYFKNMLHFRDLYPTEDLSPIMRPLLAYSLSEDGEGWGFSRTATLADGTLEDMHQQLNKISEWLRNRSLISVNC